jgi:hypothetical protein
MTGEGFRTWEDGTEYRGFFIKGEKEGQGELVYGKRNFTDEKYTGIFVGNKREGFGELTKRDGTVIKGTFVNNQPNGDCTVTYAVKKMAQSDICD